MLDGLGPGVLFMSFIWMLTVLIYQSIHHSNSSPLLLSAKSERNNKHLNLKDLKAFHIDSEP